MREILFRGQTRRYGEKVRMNGEKVPSNWVYGGVLQGVGSHSIIYGGGNAEDPSEGLAKNVVYTDTIGQFTGLTDKNGKKVFEGDVVKAVIVRDLGGGTQNREETGIVGYDKIGMIGLITEYSGAIPVWSDFFQELTLSGCIDDFWFDVIGNIHDNPELLGGAEDGTLYYINPEEEHCLP